MKTLSELVLTPSDINEHLNLLANYSDGRKVVEIGFRTGNSATAFLHGCSHLTSIDIRPCDTAGFIETGRFTFVLGDSMTLTPIASDLLFIDGNHDYDYVMSDLQRFGSVASTFIALHDTARLKAAGVRRAVLTWLADHHNWCVMEDRQNNEGLMVLRRTHP